MKVRAKMTVTFIQADNPNYKARLRSHNGFWIVEQQKVAQLALNE